MIFLEMPYPLILITAGCVLPGISLNTCGSCQTYEKAGTAGKTQVLFYNIYTVTRTNL